MRRGLAQWVVIGACLVSRAIGEEPRAKLAGDSWRILIRPGNYDPADPWEYTQRRGALAPGMWARGPIWNRSFRGEKLGQVGAISDSSIVLGYSVRGNPIVMRVFGQGTKPILIFGAIHGNEEQSAVVARKLIELLDEEAGVYGDQCVAIITAANPDGLARDTRMNARGVDVNRNFPAKNWKKSSKGATFSGEEPESEPETRAIIKAVDLLQPARIVSIHTITNGRHGNNFDGPGEELARSMSEKNGYKVLKSIGYPTPGSFGSWAGIDRQIPTITLELPDDLPSEECWKQNREALLAAIRFRENEAVGK